jgi:hypothetical protein
MSKVEKFVVVGLEVIGRPHFELLSRRHNAVGW